ncbi:MAG: InlB B-repeat-containing protein [Acutalibacteraceae bacterium]
MYRKLTALILSLSILIGIMPIINLNAKAETSRPKDINGNEWTESVFAFYEDCRTLFKGKNKFTIEWNGFLARGSELKDGKYPIVDDLGDDPIQYVGFRDGYYGTSIVIKHVPFDTHYDEMWTMEYYDTTSNADRYKICLSDGVTYLKDNTGSLATSGADLTVTQNKDEATAWDLRETENQLSFGHDINYTDPHFKINTHTSNNGVTRYSLDLTREISYPIYDVYVEMPWITTKFLKEDGSAYKQDMRQIDSFFVPEGPDKTGYTFVGWTETKGSSTVSIKAGDYIMPKESKNYYPVYKPNNYTVRFYPDSTLSGEYVEQSFVYDASKNLRANSFLQKAATFNCWINSDDATKTYKDAESVKNLTATAGGIVNLYADWNENSYTVEYSANYGTGSPESKTVKYSEAFTLPDETAVTRDGYTLVGWSYTPDGSGEGFAPGLSVSRLTAEADGKIKFYAIWEKSHTHTPGDWETTLKPTCTATGEKVRRCTDCNCIVEIESINALGHKNGAPTTKIPATCTAEGLKTVCCETCGVVLSEEIIQKKDHTPGVWQTSKSATCTDSGEKVKICVDCNCVVEVESIDPLGHKESAVAVTNKEATCTAEGEKVFFCERCGIAVKTEVIQKTEHIPGKWEIIKEPTCTQSGLKQQCCALCGALLGEPVEIEPHDHSPGEWATVLAPDCERDGEKVKSCTVCGGTIESEAIPALGHTDGVWVTAVEPTCVTEGQQIKICTRCEKTIESEPIEALGHMDGIWVTAVEPTCVTEGQQIKNCIRCGETIESEPIEALGHIPGIERTCVTDQSCVVCGTVLAYADGVSHVWSEWSTCKAAGFFTEEEQVRRCSACGEEEYRFVKGTAGCHKYFPHSGDGENCESCDALGRVNSFFRNVAKTFVYLVFGNVVVNVLFPTLALHFHEWFDIK